jgi:glucose-1-phosphate thymidylyltransferase
MKAIILAAGYATRLYPLTKNIPKPLLKIKGRPIIDYLVDQANQLPDLDEIIVVSNHRFVRAFENWAAQRKARAVQQENAPGTHTDRRSLPVTILDDGTRSENERLGAIGDIQYCIDQCSIDDDLLVMAGDNLFTWSLLEAWRHFKQYGNDMIVGHALDNPEDRYRFAIAEVDSDGLVTHLEEKPSHPRSDIGVYAIYFYRRDTVPLFRQYLAEGNNPDAPGHFPTWLYKKKPIRVYFFEGQCIDIGTPEAYKDVKTTFPVSVSGEQEESKNKEEKTDKPLA